MATLLLLCLYVTSVWQHDVALAAADSSTSQTRGVMLTSVKQWVDGRTQQICLTAHQLESVDVTVELQSIDNNATVYGRTTFTVSATDGHDSNLQKCQPLTLSLNGDSVSQVRLFISATNDRLQPSYVFQRGVDIEVRRIDMTSFIETDKAVYKPSDKVRLRLLTVRGPEAQIVTDAVELVYIEDPSGTRVAQWTNIQTDHGLVQLEMALSEEPPLGQWSITTLVLGHREKASFTVKEYVLPKFEVSIVHPSRLYFQQQKVSWKVCATYTYGEPVAGEVKLSALCITDQYWRVSNNDEPWQCFEQTKVKLMDGCATLDLNNSSPGRILPNNPYQLWSTKLRLTAQVKEKGTGVTLNATDLTVDLVRDEYQVDINKYNRQHFKPLFDFIGYGVVSRADDTPAISRRVSLQIGDYPSYGAPPIWKQNVSSDSMGRFQFTIPSTVLTRVNNQSLTVKAFVGSSETSSSLSLTPWFSPSNSYLQIQKTSAAQDVAQCRSQLTVDFVYKTPNSDVYNDLDNNPLLFTYLIVSRGNIVESGTVEARQTSATVDHTSVLTVRRRFAVNVSAAMSGSFDVTVFHVRSDVETVADNLHVKVEPCFPHQVSMSFASERVQPGRETSVLIETDSQSLCAVGIVDKSVELMGKSTWLTADKVNSIQQSYQTTRPEQSWRSSSCQPAPNSNSDDDFDYDDNPWMPRPRPRPRQPTPSRSRRMIMYPHNHFTSRYVDSTEAFEHAGVVTLTDLTLYTRPCQRYRPVLYASAYGGRGRSMARAKVGALPDGAPGRVQEAAFAPDLPLAMSVASKQPSAPATLHRTYFPDTWLWTLWHPTTFDGNTAEVSVSVPHTITEWVGGGYCISPQSGLGVAKTFKMTAFQPFFVSFTLPYSLVRGESVAIPVTVFNYLANTCLTVTLQVERNVAFELQSFNTTSTRPELARLKVCQQQTETHTFYLVARQIGTVNFTVHASSEPDLDQRSNNEVEVRQQATASDIVTRQLLVISEGKEEEYAKSVFVCTDNEEVQTGNWSLTVPDDIVADSLRMRINVIGDVMGSALSNLDKLLQLPTGCGEQNMLKFAPNIYVLQYLTATNQLTSQINDMAINYLRTGYQRELTYRHTDGSYSAFGNSDPEGSIWLTAFVLRSFAKARPFIFIDTNDLNVSISWLRNQQLENGCFRSVGKVLHKEMTGGLQNNDTLSALTAYIVISLLEADISKTDTSVVNAFRCLSAHSDVNDVYTLSLMLYAYSLYGRDVTMKQRLVERVNAQAVKMSGMRYWKASDQQAQTATSYYKSANVEMTSYVLLSFLQSSGTDSRSQRLDTDTIGDNVQIVRWLTTQRNAYGGFSSTQDTVLGLQALSLFATNIFRSGQRFQLAVNVSGQGQSQSFNFDVTGSNRLLQQSANAGAWQLPTTVQYAVSGSGCALVQAAVKYNRLSLASDQPRRVFNLEVSVKQVPKLCKTATIRTCARYTGNDQASNMVVVETRMVSGWIPDKPTVHKLKNDASLGVKRIEIDKNVVNLYFDQLNSVKKCWEFVVTRDLTVKDTKPSLVHIYDYYTPGTSVYRNYSLIESCSNELAPLEQRQVVDGVGRKPLSGHRSNGKTHRSKELPAIHASTNSTRQQKQAKTSRSRCPVCLNETGSFRQLFCNSTYVYNVSVTSQSAMTLQRVVRQPNNSSTVAAAAAFTDIKYKVSRECRCSLLSRGSKMLVLASRPLTVKSKRFILDLRSVGEVTLINLNPTGGSSSLSASEITC